MVKYRVIDIKVNKMKFFNSEKSCEKYYKKNCRRQDLLMEKRVNNKWIEHNIFPTIS